MEKTLEQLLKINGKIFDNYNSLNKEELIKNKKIEKEILNQVDTNTLYKMHNDISDLEESKKLDNLDDYEILLYENDSNIIIRRVFNSISYTTLSRPFYEEFNRVYGIEDTLVLNNQYTFVSKISNNSILELVCKMYSNISMKFLLFLKNSELTDYHIQYIINKMSFIDVHIEDKLIENDFNVDECVKKEDELYDNLWENNKQLYKHYLQEYCINYIDQSVLKLISSVDQYSNYNVKIRGAYLRSLLNYLDDDLISEIYNNYNSVDLNSINKNGEYEVYKSFKKATEDKELIKKIKTR